MNKYPSFEIRTSGAVTIVDIPQRMMSEFDFSEQLAADFRDFVRTFAPNLLLVNLGGVEMIGSSTIGVLVAAHKTLHAEDGRIAMCNVHPKVRLIFQTLNLAGTLFDIYETEDIALANFG